MADDGKAAAGMYMAAGAYAPAGGAACMAASMAESNAAGPCGIMAEGGYPTGAGTWPRAGRIIPVTAKAVSTGQVHAHRMFITQSPQLSKLRARLGKMATSGTATIPGG